MTKKIGKLDIVILINSIIDLIAKFVSLIINIVIFFCLSSIHFLIRIKFNFEIN